MASRFQSTSARSRWRLAVWVTVLGGALLPSLFVALGDLGNGGGAELFALPYAMFLLILMYLLVWAAALRAGLHSLLREHVWLAASATGGALGGRMPQFEAAATALNGPLGSNTADIVDAIRGVYGDDVGTAFDGLWRSEDHIPAFVAYTQAVAADDQAGKDAAVERLTSYAKTFGETMNSVNQNLPADVVEEAITTHATTLLAVIDAQKAGDPAEVIKLLREAVHHMSGTADAFASATAKQFPEQF